MIGPVPLHNLRIPVARVVSKKKHGRFKDALISVTISVESARPMLMLLDDSTAFERVFATLPVAPVAFVEEEERVAFASVRIVFPTSPLTDEEERVAFPRVLLRSPLGLEVA